jgi:hypothetical protein
LTPNPRNTFAALPPDELARLREDVKARGVLVPLVVMPAKRNPDDGSAENHGGTILAGHNRHAVALALGLDAVPVQYVNRKLSAPEERRFIVADNLLRRQLSPEDKAQLLAELYPGYFDDDGQPGRKKELAHGEPITQKDVARAAGVSVETVKRAKATHKIAKDKAATRGAVKPTPDDYRAAADARNKARKNKAASDKTLPVEPNFPGMEKADQVNKGKGPRPFKAPDLSGMLGRLLDAAADRVGQDDPGTIASDLVAGLKRAGLL